MFIFDRFRSQFFSFVEESEQVNLIRQGRFDFNIWVALLSLFPTWTTSHAKCLDYQWIFKCQLGSAVDWQFQIYQMANQVSRPNIFIFFGSRERILISIHKMVFQEDFKSTEINTFLICSVSLILINGK